MILFYFPFQMKMKDVIYIDTSVYLKAICENKTSDGILWDGFFFSIALAFYH